MEDVLRQMIMQSQKVQRRVEKFGDTYPIEKKQSGRYQIFIRELPLARAFIGAGIWDASIILSRYLFAHKDLMKSRFRNCLELGSGVGLTGITLSLFQPTILTDYKLSILENIQYNIDCNDDEEMMRDIIEDKNSLTLFLESCKLIKQNSRISYLNWYDLAKNAPDDDPSFVPGSLMKVINSQAKLEPLLNNKYQLIVGCEVCYCEEVVNAIFNTIEQYLADDGVFWLVQSIFRGPGLKALLKLLELKNFIVECRIGDCITKYQSGLSTKQSTSGRERYYFWTIFKQQNGNNISKLGEWDDCEIVDFNQLNFTYGQ